jgi:hypothetical protein
MDFKGDVALSRGGRCFPLPIIDDHSRYLIGLFACGDQTERTVRGHLETLFAHYGLPEELLCDNGTPWGNVNGPWTRLRVWLLRHGVKLRHGRPYHPQTQGKEERLNRTLQADVLQRTDLPDLAGASREFAAWREVYNWERPHDALALAVPASRYRMSARSYAAPPAPYVYGPDDEVRPVYANGTISWRGRSYFIGEAFAGEQVGLRPGAVESWVDVFFCHQRLGQIDLRERPPHRRHALPLRPWPKEMPPAGPPAHAVGASPPVAPPLRSAAPSGEPPTASSPWPPLL